MKECVRPKIWADFKHSCAGIYSLPKCLSGVYSSFGKRIKTKSSAWDGSDILLDLLEELEEFSTILTNLIVKKHD